MNIYLVGMPGSGKTEMGKKLAKELNLRFRDTDEEVTRLFSKTPEELIVSEGERALREAEKKVLEKILRSENLLVATGGGFPVFNQIMDRLNEEGLTVYLSYGVETLWMRLKESHVRPLAQTKEDLEELLNQRKSVYEKAKIIYTGGEYLGENQDLVKKKIEAFLNGKK